MAQFESGRLWKKYLLKIKLDNLTIFIENPTTKDQSLTASWQFTSACASSKSCKDLSELIFSIDKRINHPFRCIKRSIVSLIKHRQPCLISLLDHLMNHVTFLARLYTVYVRINLGSSVVLLVNTSGTSPFSIALVRSASRHCVEFSSLFSQPWLALIHGIVQHCFASSPQPWFALFRDFQDSPPAPQSLCRWTDAC